MAESGDGEGAADGAANDSSLRLIVVAAEARQPPSSLHGAERGGASGLRWGTRGRNSGNGGGATTCRPNSSSPAPSQLPLLSPFCR